MDEQERTEVTPGDEATELRDEQPAGATEDAAAGGDDALAEQLRIRDEEIARLKAEAAERERRSAPETGRTEAQPTTPVASPEQALDAERHAIEAERYAIMELEAQNGPSVESIRRAQKLIQREQRFSSAVTAYALKKNELNTFVGSLPRDEQAGFRAFVATKGHLYANLEVAYEGFELARLKSERSRTKASAERAESIIKRNDEGRVGSATREVSAAEAKSKKQQMTAKQFDDEYDRLERMGDVNGLVALSQRMDHEGLADA